MIKLIMMMMMVMVVAMMMRMKTTAKTKQLILWFELALQSAAIIRMILVVTQHIPTRFGDIAIQIFVTEIRSSRNCGF